MKRVVAVVGVFWNELCHLPSWFQSVEAQQSESLRVFPVIVRNKHHDARVTADLDSLLSQFIRDGRIESEWVVRPSANLGHTCAFNLAARQLSDRGDLKWIATLDPDARFAAGAVERLIEAGDAAPGIGMVSPIVLRSRPDHSFDNPRNDECVLHVGHFPAYRTKPLWGLNYRWRSHHDSSETLSSLRAKLTDAWQPFSVCFCAAVGNKEMLLSVGFADSRQFRTLNCGELCYHARLQHWKACCAADAVAFHPTSSPVSFCPAVALTSPGSAAWLYHHCSLLIARRYFPDEHRPATGVPRETNQWADGIFADLSDVEAVESNERRRRVFDSWSSGPGWPKH